MLQPRWREISRSAPIGWRLVTSVVAMRHTRCFRCYLHDAKSWAEFRRAEFRAPFVGDA